MKGAPRKLRKSCSLPTCSKTPGECMHCTCDGRCGQHVAGHCGVRREGNGKSCKREGCARDDSCLHSTRATCCHCRNLVSSSNRSSRKRTRVETAKPLLAAKADVKTDDDGAASPTGVDALLPLSADIFGDFEICEELLAKRQKIDEALEDETDDIEDPKNTEADAAEPQEQPTAEEPPATRARKALAEYPQWAARRHLSNLLVVVEGVQFNLHKHPMLLESQLLNSKAREAVLTMHAPVPVIQLPSFPGGAEAFEALCVYAYSGELEFTADMAAAVFAGVHFLNMGLAVKTQAREYMSSLMRNGSSLSQLVRVTQDAASLAEKHDALMVCQELQMECVDAVARVLLLDMAAVRALMSLPSELFLQITQEMLATRGPRELAVDTVRQLCIQAELAQNHRDAQEDSSKVDTSNTRCLELLSQALTPSGRLAADDEEEDDALFMKMMCDFELEPSVEDDVDVDGSFVDALALEPFAFAGRVGNNRLMAEAFAV